MATYTGTCSKSLGTSIHLAVLGPTQPMHNWGLLLPDAWHEKRHQLGPPHPYFHTADTGEVGAAPRYSPIAPRQWPCSLICFLPHVTNCNTSPLWKATPHMVFCIYSGNGWPCWQRCRQFSARDASAPHAVLLAGETSREGCKSLESGKRCLSRGKDLQDQLPVVVSGAQNRPMNKEKRSQLSTHIGRSVQLQWSRKVKEIAYSLLKRYHTGEGKQWSKNRHERRR